MSLMLPQPTHVCGLPARTAGARCRRSRSGGPAALVREVIDTGAGSQRTFSDHSNIGGAKVEADPTVHFQRVWGIHPLTPVETAAGDGWERKRSVPSTG